MSIKVIAHRGASGYAPENTLAAFKLAKKLSADGIELDVHLTKDSKIVAIHDKKTERTTNKNLTVKETDYKELEKLDAGSWFNKKFKGEKIPLLESVISRFKDIEIYIEVKTGKEMAQPLNQLLKNTNTENITVFSFNLNFLKEWKKLNKNIKTLYIVEHGYNIDIDTPLEAVIETIKSLSINGISTNSNIKRWKKEYKKLLKEKLFWNVWTVNSGTLAKEFLNLGVNSITSNYPDKIKKAISGV